MPTELVTQEPPSRRPEGPHGWPGGGGPGGRGGETPQAAGRNAAIAVGMLIVAVGMLFVAFTTAYVARRQEAGWIPLVIPPVLWLNTAVLLGSSGTLEWARKQLRAGAVGGFRPWLEWTALLGALFLVGQLAAWRQLAAQGIYLASNPHSSFYFLLTGAHGLHLLGGLGALAVVLARAASGRYTPEDHTGLSAFALYWHFMDGLWLYLFALLFWA